MTAPAPTGADASTPAPLGAMGLLARARARIERLTATESLAEQRAGAMIVDLRTSEHRAVAENIPGAIAIDTTVLPWRLDPTFERRIPEATSWDARYILVCRHGYCSSVYAAMLREMGLVNAIDIDGGYDAWVAAGLPTTREPVDIRD